jgi:hypothetical protein
MSKFFRDLVLMDDSAINGKVVFILRSCHERFCSSACIFTFEFHAIYFDDFLTWILLNGFIETWTFVPSLMF